MESDDYFPVMLLQIINQEHMTGFAVAICILFVLLCCVSILSVAESAISVLSQEEIKDAEDKRDKIVLRLSNNPRLLHMSCRLVYFFMIVAIVVLLSYCVTLINIELYPNVYYPILFIGTMILWLIFYGIMPKFLFANKPHVVHLMAPLLDNVTKIGRVLIHLTAISVEHSEIEPKKSQLSLINEAPNDIYEEKEMLEEIIHFYNKTANEIMTPRTDMEAVDIKCSFKELLHVIIDSGYSRIPVYEEDEDDIKGVLYAKDIIPALNKAETFAWQSLIRKPYFVPETKKIDNLLEEFRANKIHMAIVVDEFGSTSGIVTMEDIIEEIVGDISDEYDEDELPYVKLPDGGYIFEGKTQLNDFFRETGVPSSDFVEHTEEAETLTGLVLAIKGTLPQRREIIDYKNYRFRILEADERRVLKVKFSIMVEKKEEKRK